MLLDPVVEGYHVLCSLVGKEFRDALEVPPVHKELFKEGPDLVQSPDFCPMHGMLSVFILLFHHFDVLLDHDRLARVLINTELGQIVEFVLLVPIRVHLEVSALTSGVCTNEVGQLLLGVLPPKG